MLIYNCTSTLYHPPVMTVIMIVVNVLVFGVSASAQPETVSEYCLWYGNGFHPVQWLTSGFLHADFGHLLGNMLFLWPFGMLVEGKLGWGKFLVMYLVIAIGQNALEQTIMLGAKSTVDVSEVMDELAEDPEFAEMPDEEKLFLEAMLEAQLGNEVRRSLGASAVIFGLLAVCILWAPMSEFSIWWRFGTFDAPVMLVGAFYFAWEAVKWHMGGMGISSAALHLLGLLTGAVVGMAYLRWGIPDCDNLDLFNHLFSTSIERTPREKKNKPPRPTKESRLKAAKQKVASKKKSGGKSSDRSSDRIDKRANAASAASSARQRTGMAKANAIINAIDQGDVIAAAKGLQAQASVDTLCLIPSEKFRLACKRALASKQWSVSAVILQKWIVAYPVDAEPRKLQLAKILLLGLQRPEQARSVLGKVARQKLSGKQEELYKQLVIKLRAAQEADHD